MKLHTFRYLVILLFALIPYVSQAQFYNGHQMTFGKNRVQYNDFYWQYYRFDRYDTYFYEDGRDLAQYTADMVQKTLPEIENFFGYVLQKRVIFLVFNRLSDFRQSNIGLVTGNSEFNTGGVTQILDNKVFLYFDGNRQHFDLQIRKAIAQVILTEMLYGGNFREKVANSTLLSLPEWFEQGLISYAASQWNFEVENIVKDAIENGKYKKINQLRGDDAMYAGHSIWYFIGEVYGKDVIPNIIYLTRINKNPDSGFSYVIGSSIKYLAPEWLDFYKTRFAKETQGTALPDSVQLVKRPKKQTVYQQIKISPTGKHIAYVTNIMGKYKIYLYDTETGKTKRILKREHKLEQITDYSYPVLAWHPSGKNLTYFTESQGQLWLNQYFLDTDETKSRLMLYFDKILDFSYADNGMFLVMSADMYGQTDIYVFSMSAGTSERITQDRADDFNPRFIENSTKIIFSSNRISDTLVVEKKEHAPVNRTFDLFVYDYKNKANTLSRITSTPYINETQPFEAKKSSYVFLSDANGIRNRYLATYDSTISYIDTTTHYRYFTTEYPLTNYPRNIEEHYLSKKGEVGEIFLTKNKFKMFVNKISLKNNKIDQTTNQTALRKKTTRLMYKQDSIAIKQTENEQKQKFMMDSLKANPPKNIVHPDSSLIDINNYVFEREKDISYRLLFENQQDTVKQEPSDSTRYPKQRIYLTSFYTNYIVNQVDFGSLSESYQAFTGGAFYFNPGLNVFSKLGVNDLFEDYKIIGGMRIAGNLNSFEYLLSIENLKKRLDKQLLFHRESFLNEGDTITKVVSQELQYILRYPLNQVTAFKTTFSMRLDKGRYMSTDRYTLNAKPAYQAFAGVKGEYIFDNTIELGLNLYNGMRHKVFTEFYQQVEGKYTYLVVLGADFRYYQKIHRSMIFASRFATSTSFGSAKLIYYLGGVDNWTPLSPNVQMFDPSIRVNPDANYVYQAVATNMRGFTQNIRNGNTFALINNEIRLPVFRYFANRPLNSDFFNNFQIVGFFDAGSAWTGISPYSKENAYNEQIIQNGPITVRVKVDRSPFVAGYGFGLRSRLFGYFMRLDWAWGIEGQVILPRIFYFSLNLDF